MAAIDERKEALDLIRAIVAEEVDANISDIDEDTTLAGDLDMTRDSIHQVLAACEVEFDIQYEPEDYDDIRSVGDILASLDEWE